MSDRGRLGETTKICFLLGEEKALGRKELGLIESLSDSLFLASGTRLGLPWAIPREGWCESWPCRSGRDLAFPSKGR